METQRTRQQRQLPRSESARARAIVIGINQINNEPRLTKPVDQACRFVDWLIDPDKGGVLREDVTLLTNPDPLAGRVPKGVDIKRANRDNLIDMIHDYPARAGERERLYFYYSGHGMAFDRKGFMNLNNQICTEDGLLPCNFDPGKVKPISLPWILSWFLTSRYVEQFYFLDMCRNLTAKDDPVGGKPGRRSTSRHWISRTSLFSSRYRPAASRSTRRERSATCS